MTDELQAGGSLGRVSPGAAEPGAGGPGSSAASIVAAAERLAAEITRNAQAEADAIRARAGSDSDAARAAIDGASATPVGAGRRDARAAGGDACRAGCAERCRWRGTPRLTRRRRLRLTPPAPGLAAAEPARSRAGARRNRPPRPSRPRRKRPLRRRRPPRAVDDAGARLIALNLALSDTPRDEAARQLRDQVPDPGAAGRRGVRQRRSLTSGPGHGARRPDTREFLASWGRQKLPAMSDRSSPAGRRISGRGGGRRDGRRGAPSGWRDGRRDAGRARDAARGGHRGRPRRRRGRRPGRRAPSRCGQGSGRPRSGSTRARTGRSRRTPARSRCRPGTARLSHRSPAASASSDPPVADGGSRLGRRSAPGAGLAEAVSSSPTVFASYACPVRCSNSSVVRRPAIACCSSSSTRRSRSASEARRPGVRRRL